VLADTPSPVSAWPDKIQAITRGQTLIPPVIDPGILQAVYDALFNDRQIEARYHRRYDDSVHDYLIHPLGIVFRDGVVYLVCTRNGREDIVQMALHRMRSAVPLEAPVKRPTDFDLQRYVETGGLDFKLGGEPLRLALRIDAATAVHLEETPLSADQTLTEGVDGRMQLVATVADTAQVRWWLLGLGDQVEVIAPATLRDEIAQRLGRAAAQYGP